MVQRTLIMSTILALVTGNLALAAPEMDLFIPSVASAAKPDLQVTQELHDLWDHFNAHMCQLKVECEWI